MGNNEEASWRRELIKAIGFSFSPAKALCQNVMTVCLFRGSFISRKINCFFFKLNLTVSKSLPPEKLHPPE